MTDPRKLELTFADASALWDAIETQMERLPDDDPAVDRLLSLRSAIEAIMVELRENCDE